MQMKAARGCRFFKNIPRGFLFGRDPLAGVSMGCLPYAQSLLLSQNKVR
jgi:hypothetical protein